MEIATPRRMIRRGVCFLGHPGWEPGPGENFMMQTATRAFTPARLATDQDQQQDALRELLGPGVDLPAPRSPDDRSDDADSPGGVIPGTRRRAEDQEPKPGGE
jgi:hypothetical protein